MLRTAYLLCKRGSNGTKTGPFFPPPCFTSGVIRRTSKENCTTRYNLQRFINGFICDFNTLTMKRKSSRTLKLINARKSINGTAENVNKAATYTIEKEILTEFEKQFPNPKNRLINFYRQAAQYFKDHTYFLLPQYQFDALTKTWTCTIAVKWPDNHIFKYSSTDKKRASHYTSLTTLHYLKTIGLIENIPFNGTLTKKDYILLNTAFPEPIPLVYQIYDKVAFEKNDSNFLLRPFYNYYDDITSWSCKIDVKWPESIRFTQNSKIHTDSLKLATHSILKYLTENNRLNKLNQPILNVSNNNLMSTPNYNLLSDIGGVVLSQPRRNLSTEIKKRGSKRVSAVANLQEDNEIIDATEGKPSVKEINELNVKRKINPKNVLNSIYSLLSQELKDKSLILKPVYHQKSLMKGVVQWQCNYYIKWPQEHSFTFTSKSKQDASDKAAALVLEYLRTNGHINANNKPMKLLNSIETNVKQSNVPVLQFKDNVLKNIGNIIESYENDMVPLLVKSTQDEDASACTMRDLENEWPEMNQMHMQKYRGLHHYVMKEVTDLPITSYKDTIIESVKNNRVVIIKGEPGCGKSTRVPQYVLEGWAKDSELRDKGCRIVITQPRRIAAVSLAERVASERKEMVGGTVGYQIRFKTNFDRRSGNILYCTTGILLRRMQTDPNLTDCSHIILDEAHERDVNTDLLLNLLRSAIKRNPHVKLLVMSATIDAEVFQDYFQDAAVIHIPGFTFPVKVNYINKTKKTLEKTIAMCESKIPAVIPEEVVLTIKNIHNKRDEGAILCFLPGWEDIVKIRNLLSLTSNMFVVCLHSRIPDEEQRKIYSKPPPGVRKVILSTNIAETSVTVDDVKYIVDTGIHKEKRFDVEKGIVVMDNHWISKASMTQRKGRAGRVSSGESFHLYPESKYNGFNDYSLPEILRTSLTKIVLDCKVYSNNMPAKDFLSQLLSPPKEAAVEIAVDELKSLELLDSNENLTPLGRVLTNFQLEPKLAKAMVNSVIFKCVTPIVDIVTLFSAETELFAGGISDKQSINKYKKEFSKSSDHLSMMRLFEKWLEYIENMDNTMADQFCRANDLVRHKLVTIQKLRDIHFEYLRKGLLSVLPIGDENSDSDELVKAVMLSGVGTVLQHRNYDFVKGRMKQSNVLLTRNNHKANITPDSVNFKRSDYPSNFLMYINETRSEIRRITVVRETSLISPIAVILFKNNNLIIENLPEKQFSDKLDSQDQVKLKLENTKIEFICDRDQAILLQRCKTALNSGVQYYTYQLTKGAEYDKQLNLIWDDILLSLSNLLNIEAV